MDIALPFNITTLELSALSCLFLLTIVVIATSAALPRRIGRWIKQKSLAQDGNARTNLPALSVIVYAPANCSEALQTMIPLLMEQNYPDYEVIVVNADKCGHVGDALTRLGLEYPHLRTTFTPENSCNVSIKKLSITLGIKAAVNDFVLITSALCRPESDQWLTGMARHFAKGADIVVGYAHSEFDNDMERGRRYRAYDETEEAAVYLNAALCRRPFRCHGSNIAYRKQLFFDNRGFSSSLNLKYGDDDIFLKEIARRGKTAVELSPETILLERHDDFRYEFRLQKLFRCFTQRRTRPLINGETVRQACYYLFLLAVACTIGYAAWITLQTNEISDYWKAGAIGGAALLLFIVQQLSDILTYRKTARLLQGRMLFFTVPVLRFVRPFRNCIARIKSRHAGNYTWQ